MKERKKIHAIQISKLGWAWFQIPVVPAMQEAEAGEFQCTAQPRGKEWRCSSVFTGLILSTMETRPPTITTASQGDLAAGDVLACGALGSIPRSTWRGRRVGLGVQLCDGQPSE